MKDELVITLSSLGGSRDIVVTWKAKLWVGAACTGLLCMMAAMGTTIVLTRNSLAAVQAQLSVLEQGNLTQKQHAEALPQALSEKASEEKNSEDKAPSKPSVDEKVERSPKKGQAIDPGERSPTAANVLVVPRNSVVPTSNEGRLLLGVIPNGTPFKNAARISSYFGLRRHPILGRIRSHKGIDFVAHIGTPVYATAGGVVSKVTANSAGGYGRQVLIQHGLGFSSRYAHLSQVSTKSGAHVVKGALLGLTGNSGRSTGPHLHYEVLYRGKALDPINFARWSSTNFESIFTKEKEIPWASLIRQSHQWSQMASLPLSPKAVR
ncbi:murein DD-endopeptidase MepM/ murein hydrolase activator NlpD [Pseudomonas fluorescens]|uniref:M23 family metallopeptidase n=1 Tax=Pseudomonas fluorescens TaxID=294 RepID=UPI00209C8067|nr:M23 family metallopeptidase [Pseudomonas fluorescens]MCP1489895.1 murein DD-endopeptidase MepM/ murein hydrolase activator NlpD [Pseudomonas fluorescens]